MVAKTIPRKVSAASPSSRSGSKYLDASVPDTMMCSLLSVSLSPSVLLEIPVCVAVTACVFFSSVNSWLGGEETLTSCGRSPLTRELGVALMVPIRIQDKAPSRSMIRVEIVKNDGSGSLRLLSPWTQRVYTFPCEGFSPFVHCTNFFFRPTPFVHPTNGRLSRPNTKVLDVSMALGEP